MFYSRTFLARKSPLGAVWIAAHLQHKLRKSHVVVTDIPTSVDCIMFPEVPIALRLSGHLLLGVVRIYSKKVDYLHHDCNEFLTQIRTKIASIQVNLPEDASHAPFHSITLPETFELDALNLDDAMYKAGAPDNHLRAHDEITMTDQIPGEGDPYVAFFIDEDIRLDASPQVELPNFGPEPMGEDGTSPPGNNVVGITDPGLSNRLGESNQKLYEDHVSQDLPEMEVLRDAVQVQPCNGDNNAEWPDLGDDIVEQHEPFDPTMNQKASLSPIMEGLSVSGGESLPSQLHPMPPTSISVEEPELFNLRNSLGPSLFEMALQPTPPVEKKKEISRKRKQLFDEHIVFSNKFIKKQLQDTGKLVRKRKKLPLSALDVWRSTKRLQHENLFLEPSISGMCTNLQEIFKKSFIASKFNPVPTETLPERRVAQSTVGTPAFDMEIEQPRFDEHVGGPLPEFDQSPFGREELTPVPASNLGSVSQTGNGLEAEVQTPELPTIVESGGLKPQTPIARLDEQLPKGDTSFPQIPAVLSSAESPLTWVMEQRTVGDGSLPKTPEMLNFPESEELSFLDAEDTPTRHEEREVNSLTVRTRRMAQYLKEQSPSTQISESILGYLSLNRILERETRKRCARMFYETLVLKSYGFIDVQQEEAYGDITLSLTPSPLKTKF